MAAGGLQRLKAALGLDRSPPAVALLPSLVINDDLDATLLRFLKARQGSVEKASAMLLKCLSWREEAHTASMFSRPLSPAKFRHLCRYFPHAHHGFDKQGQPIYIDLTGLLEVDALLEVVSKEEVLQSHIIMMEYQNRVLMTEGSRRVGRTVHRMCNIVDMTGASTRLASRKAMDVFKLIAAVDQDNYPETMGATYVVNAPWVFTAIWRLVRVFLDEGVTAKVHILGEGQPSRAALLAAVDAEQLPAFLGGTCRCSGGCVSGPGCSSADGLVASQRRLQAYCEEYRRAMAAGEVDEHGVPVARAPAHAVAAAITQRGGKGGGGGSAGVRAREEELERQLAFRKAADYPALTSRAPAEEQCGALDPDGAARAAAEAAAAARLALQEAREAAAESAAAHAQLRAASEDAHVAQQQAQAAAKVAQHASAEEARLTGRTATTVAASALASRVRHAGHMAADAVGRLSPLRALGFAPTSQQSLPELKLSAAGDDDDDDAPFEDALETLAEEP